MGWWSEDIMGGDTPLDLEAFIYDALEIEHDGEIKIPKEVFDYHKIIKHLNDRDGDNYWLEGDTGNIFHQVLGVMMMEVGAPISKPLKAMMITAAKNDEWANNGSLEREERMDRFIYNINHYVGSPIETKAKGLMETIFDGEAIKDLNKDLNNDLKRRVGWLGKRITLTDTDKDYITLMMKEFAEYYYTKFKKQ